MKFIRLKAPEKILVKVMVISLIWCRVKFMGKICVKAMVNLMVKVYNGQCLS